VGINSVGIAAVDINSVGINSVGIASVDINSVGINSVGMILKDLPPPHSTRVLRESLICQFPNLKWNNHRS
jgi:hypothetical protein